MRSPVPTIVFLLLSPAIVFALGLGDIVVNSALNQPLKARVELLSASPDELDSLKVVLADSNTFAKAGIDRPYILGKLRFDIQRSDDDSPDHISISTQTPIREPFLNFLIELCIPMKIDSPIKKCPILNSLIPFTFDKILADL